MFIKNKQNGDTIVEVLIAVSIVSLILVGAFKIANNSLRQVQSAKERSEALKIAESSIEKLEIIQTPTPGQDFCIKPDYTIPVYNDNDCTTNNRYKTKIRVDTNAANINNYIVTVNWDGPLGFQEELTLAYRVSK